ncbi:MAG: hypothetical protein E4H09_00430 [Spirochaetales bacterium]|nr:MAG: hypothetical protein E4H09_00430 [Spirochaetales bacterium]
MPHIRHQREPDFRQFLRVLRNQVPDRPVLYELFLNDVLYQRLAGRPAPVRPGATASPGEIAAYLPTAGKWYADAFAAAGYDYATLSPTLPYPGLRFRSTGHQKLRSHSLNEGAVISGWNDVESFPWPDTTALDPAAVDAVTSEFPDWMQATFVIPNGILENLIELVGYDQLCYLLVDDRPLVKEISDRIGASLMGFYNVIASHPRVGFLIVNDDWGFKTQTMISPDDLREFVFPWVRKFTAAAQEAGKPVLLHSCGQLESVMDDVIDDLGFSAKHSFEDVILPIEDAYERWGERIALMGGIDVDYLCTANAEAITTRSRAMLERAANRGGYALGSGNSIPEYIPTNAYFAMTRAALER